MLRRDEVERRDSGAPGDERRGQGAPYPPGRAGDEDDLAVEPRRRSPHVRCGPPPRGAPVQ